MPSTPPDDPQPGKELPLSRAALLELMRAALARGVPFRFRALGSSMAPFIRDGDVITVSPLLSRGPMLGEVVAYTDPESGKLVVHRVVDARSGSGGRGGVAVIRGDALHGSPDEVVPLANILGNVTRVEREGRLVRLGLGPQGRTVAWLSRARLLLPLRIWVSCWRGRARAISGVKGGRRA